MFIRGFYGSVFEGGFDGSQFGVKGRGRRAPAVVVMPRGGFVMVGGVGKCGLRVTVVESSVGINDDAPGLGMQLFDLYLQVLDPCLKSFGSFFW